MNSPAKRVRFTPHALAIAVVSASVSTGVLAAESAEQTTPKNNKHRELEMIQVIGQATSGLDNLVTLEQLENMQANSLDDVFQMDPQISVGGSVGMGQKIYVRNVGEDMLNISVDGAEQAGSIFHHSGRITIEPELLKQVEVEAGAGSATAGPGALGGSVRFTTKDPLDLLKPGETFGSLIKASYFSNGEGYKGSATLFGADSGGVLSGMVSMIDSDFDNFEDGEGDEILGTGFGRKVGYAKAVANLSEEHYLSLSFERLEEEGDILYKPELIANFKNVPEPTEGSRETITLNYNFDASSNDLIDIYLNAYSTQLEQDREYAGINYGGQVDTVGATLENRSLIGNHKLVYGVNYRDDESRFENTHKENGQVYGFYVQDVIQFTPDLTVAAGVRYDDYQLEDVNGQNIDSDGFSPNISANYVFAPGWSVSAGYATALRGAEVKDSFKLSSYSNDPDLKAEKAQNYELGLDYFSGNFTFAMGVYQSEIEDPIAGATPWAKYSENLDDDIETTGVYAQMSYHWEKLSLSAALNSADSELDGETVTRYQYSSSGNSTGDSLVLDMQYQFTESFFAGWTAEFVRGIDDIELVNVGGSTLTTEKPGYGLHDLYARWLPFGDDRLTVNLTVKNLFDKQYLSHASVEDFEHNPGWTGIVGSQEAGRDIRLSAAVRF
ncbi:TonB-dependent receptor domain-containing protein [Pseudomaricurvus sp.]|uniref:TonB-dependent receptor domain-containing protein n=1 Tax=Pseudomaricurvus sp. TaxID=2004510 RepID=UPI003F6D294D